MGADRQLRSDDADHVLDRSEAEREPFAQAASRRHALGLERARFAIEGNPDYRLQFDADPEGFLRRFGLTPAPVGAAPAGSVSDVRVAQSTIHGQGVVSARGLRAGEVVGKMMNQTGDDVTQMASKVNCSDHPNAQPVMHGGELVLRTVRDVEPGREVVSKYPYPR